ncbi:heparinase II/III family protein [Methylocapsa acidiphila]|uniref:heparinase II/III family protein n=1 Tax=Methylocapsa acidiphila TaxID=133552 RepID=UPI00040E737D|nr:heparinase II/III family protein [Methylocapsa acidiphila]
MAGAIFKDRLRVVGFLAARGATVIWRSLGAPLRALAGLRRRPPERLLIAPQDIRTSDPTLAADIYAGYFAFAGKIVNAHGRSPFELDPDSPAWTRALMGFSWLRHLRAADTAVARANAHALVEDFLSLAGKPNQSLAWEPQVVARRLLAWLSQSPIILEGADRAFYRRFMKGIGSAQAFLERKMAEGLVGDARLLVAIALVELCLSTESTAKAQQRTTKLLVDELERQILPDGGHVSRNPQALIDLLLDLLPLRQVYAARGLQTPAQLLNAIDRMMPMLRLFRHGDGSLALFNGMGVTAPEQIATVLAYDDVRAQALVNAPHSGYQRIEAQEAILVMDCGGPPPRAFSTRAHAGCASFEFSVGAQRLVINCGSPDANRLPAREAARMTAAHSTLVVDDTSSCRFAFHAGLGKWLGDEMVSGPDAVEVERRETTAGTMIIAAHNGYEPRFGLIHQRRVFLRKDGKELEGADRLRHVEPAGSPTERRPFAVRFHIHPSVRMKRVREGRGVLCVLPNGRRWLFETTDWLVDIEESIFFAAPDGPRGCAQIVVNGQAEADVEIEWRFRHIEKKRAPD